MNFSVFSTGNLMDADEVMDNYYYVADGDQLPFTQTAVGSLSAADAIYDIGNSTSTFVNVYCDSLQIYGSASTQIITDKNIWVLLVEVEVSVAAATISITIPSDLTAYRILLRGGHEAGAIIDEVGYIYNSDADGYAYQQILTSYGNVVTGQRDETYTRFLGPGINEVVNTNTNKYFFADITLQDNYDTITRFCNGHHFIYEPRQYSVGNPYYCNYRMAGQVHKQTTTVSFTATTILMTASGDFLVGTYVQIWGKM